MTTRKEFVSVIVPTFNDTSQDLSQTVSSVLRQTHKNFEAIIVDDGSEIPFARLNEIFQDSRLKFVNLGDNFGVAHARNRGILLSRGDYIAFLDSGDWWEPLKLEEQLKILASKNVGWVYTSTANYTSEGYVAYNYAQHEGWVKNSLLKWQIIKGSSSSVLVRKEVLDQAGYFYDQEDIIEDWDMWIRLSKISRVGFASEPLVVLKKSTIQSRSYEFAKLKRLKRFTNLHWEDYKKEGLQNLAIGRMHLRTGFVYIFNDKAFRAVISWLLLLKYKPSLFPLRYFLLAVVSMFYPPGFNKLNNKIFAIRHKLKNKLNFMYF